jgi:hypothetical protein
MQIVRAAGLTAMAVVGIAAILPLGTLIDQIKEYIAIFGTTHPLHFSFVDQQLEFLKSAWLWLVCGAILAFILFFRLGGKPVSNRLTVLVCIVAPIISAVILARTISRLDEFRIGPATGTLAFCALSLACLRKDAAPRSSPGSRPWVHPPPSVRNSLTIPGYRASLRLSEFSLLYVRMWLRSPWRHAPDYT